MPSRHSEGSAGATVSLKNANRFYGEVHALENVSLEIQAGEFFTLLGASGSGKTTILRLIGGFEQADSGKVLIGGLDMTTVPAHRRPVHTVFQDYALFPHLNVIDNVAFALDLEGEKKESRIERVKRVLEMIQLQGFEKRMPSQLSGGQQQRVALARALVDQPAVLLLDEPLSALDAKIRAELREQLKRLQRITRITFIYVTHDQEEALTLSDRIAVMRGGKVLQIGTPVEIYENPANLYVAEFIGKANFLAGRKVGAEGTKLKIQVKQQIFEANETQPIPDGSTVRLMIRPENLRIVNHGSGIISARIFQVHYLGSFTEYLIQSEDHIYRALELRRRGSIIYEEGLAVDLSWDWKDALAYPESQSAYLNRCLYLK